MLSIINSIKKNPNLLIFQTACLHTLFITSTTLSSILCFKCASNNNVIPLENVTKICCYRIFYCKGLRQIEKRLLKIFPYSYNVDSKIFRSIVKTKRILRLTWKVSNIVHTMTNPLIFIL